MHGYRYKVNARTDATLLEAMDDLVPVAVETIQIQAHRIQMPGMVTIGFVGRKFQFLEVAENLVVHLRITPSCRGELVQLLQLVHSDSRLDIAQVVLESGH